MARGTLTSRPRAVSETAPTPAPAPASSSSGKPANLQDQFLNHLRRDGQSQLVYKHAISTIMPSQPIDAGLFANGSDGGRKQRLLQDVFLSRVRDAAVQVTMFLVNGVMLQGRIAAYDLFCMLLEREGFVQLAYKHAVSTIQPASHVDLTTDWDDEDGAGGEAS